MSFKASSEYAVVVTLGRNEREVVDLFLNGFLGGMLKMVHLGKSALRFVSYKVHILGEIHVNCEIGEPHV